MSNCISVEIVIIISQFRVVGEKVLGSLDFNGSFRVSSQIKMNKE